MSRYLFKLSYKLGIPKNRLAADMSVPDVVEYMAYDLSQNEEFLKKVQKEKEIEASKKLTPEQYADKFKALLGT